MKENKIKESFNCFLKTFFHKQNEKKEQKKRKDFMNLLAHEIKTPLSVTLFYVDNLISDIDSGELSESVLKNKLIDTEKQLEKISVIINNIFQSQKNDIGNIVLNKEEVNLGEWLCQELKCFQNRYNDVDFLVDISGDVKYYSFDKELMSQVISNIVGNAIKFSNKENKKVIFKAYIEKGNINIQICDNGKGFPKKMLIDKYSTGCDKSGGLGIGLYLSEIIIKKHGGSIYMCNSQVLGGAKLIIKLKK